ncbi:MAG: hypothetical protein JSU65_02360 [Candidatus Zixiibacteriota bacterium]|nr:MAG: hypothetical protein JSU65_02360 [candidate division Zixibacteria bacterium]
MRLGNKKKRDIFRVVILPVLISGFVLAQNEVVESAVRQPSGLDSDAAVTLQSEQSPSPVGLSSGQSCTVIYASDGTVALAGNNEDYKNPFMTISYLPAEDGKLGRIYFCHGTLYPQGGMNEEGLFFDGATAERVEVPRDPGKLPYDGSLILKAMEECSTVEEVLQLYGRYDASGSWGGHYLVGDRFGNSVIIEPQTFIKKSGRYQIITNFLQSKTKPENSTDARYRLASELFEKAESISVDLFRRILNATHYEEYSGSMTTTLYSFICDLKKRQIYVYYFHNFEEAVKIDLQEALKNGQRTCLISSLFPYETFAEKRYKAERIVGMLYERAVRNGVDGSEGAIALYREMKSQDSGLTKYDVSESQLNSLGYRLLEAEKVEEAIGIFRLNVAEHPDSANVYDSLGEAYMKAGENELAIWNYEKSLDLDPGNENARKMLEELRKR